MSFAVYTTPQFDERLNELPKEEKLQVEKIFPKLAENPYQGKPLGFKFLREKKIQEMRVYYFIYDDYVCVLLVSISDKKTQKNEINNLKKNRKIYLDYAKKISKQLGNSP